MRKPPRFLMLLLCVFILSACSVQTAAQPGPAGEEGVSFTDALGRQLTVSDPQRVAVLMGSFAETWLLAGGGLAAYTEDALDERELDIPPEAVNLGLLKSPSVEKMIELDVDFAILSANLSEHVALREQLADAGIAAAYFSVETFDEYLDMLKICTDITGRADLYEENGLAVRRQIDEAIARRGHKPGPRVLFIRAFSTGARAKGSDNMTGQMLSDLGCENIADQKDSLLEDLSMEIIIEQDPDYIFVVTMGASDQKALDALANGIQANPAWSGLAAVQSGRYIVLPKNLFHLKPNNRWGESYAMLAEYLYGK